MASKTSFTALVFDLDSTLVYATSDPEECSSLPHHRITFRSYDDYEDIVSYVILRPHVNECLQILNKRFALGIWSLGTPNYVAEIVKLLDIGTPECNPLGKIQVKFIYNWTHCVRKSRRFYKPLKESPFKGEQACLIDDMPELCDENDSCFAIEPFTGQTDDDALLKLLRFLT